MNKEPDTYEELIRKKRCIDLAKYYSLTDDNLEKVYSFLEQNPKGKVIGGKNNITLKIGLKVLEVIPSYIINSAIDGLVMSNDFFRTIDHYVPSSSSYSSGGSSSNNNNNNKNNNNNN